MYKSLGCLALVAGLALAGCGESKGDRALSGGAMGAGAGRCWYDGCWAGAGAGAGARMRLTDCDWRPNERPPPTGRASATLDSVISAIIMLAKNFFISSPQSLMPVCSAATPAVRL